MENANATKRAIARIPGAKCVKKVASWIGAIWGRTSLELPDSGPLGWVKHRCQQLVDVDHDVGKYFSWFITGLILVNLVSLRWDAGRTEHDWAAT